jgi:hypothetical protein
VSGPLLVFVVLVAGSVWVGGLVVVVLVTRTVRHRLEPADAVEFQQAFGRAYGIAGGGALLVALAGGAVLLADHGWDATALATALVAGSLPVATAIGILQARRMTQLRRRAARSPADVAVAQELRAGSSRAVALRATIGLLTLAAVFLSAVLAT